MATERELQDAARAFVDTDMKRDHVERLTTWRFELDNESGAAYVAVWDPRMSSEAPLSVDNVVDLGEWLASIAHSYGVQTNQDEIDNLTLMIEQELQNRVWM
jgi:hypothetical protein